MTTEQCTSLCMDWGFQVAGVEYGDECYCGNYDAVRSSSGPGDPLLTAL